MKKKYIIASIIAVLVLTGLVLVLTLGKDGEKENGDNSGKDITVHESDKNTVEEKAEGGLKESDSEDGPVLDDDTMIDFNGGDAQTGGSTTSDDNQKDDNKPSDSKPGDEGDDEDTKDTGTWGGFY